MATTKKTKSAEAQRKRDQRDKERRLRDAEAARKREERKADKDRAEKGSGGKVKKGPIAKIRDALGFTKRQADDNRGKPTHRERYAEKVKADNEERERRKADKAKRADAIADKAGTRKPKKDARADVTDPPLGGEGGPEAPLASPPAFESDDVAAIAGYPPDVTEEQYENIVRKSALGY
jgi:hypothetical protein